MRGEPSVFVNYVNYLKASFGACQCKLASGILM